MLISRPARSRQNPLSLLRIVPVGRSSYQSWLSLSTGFWFHKTTRAPGARLPPSTSRTSPFKRLRMKKYDIPPVEENIHEQITRPLEVCSRLEPYFPTLFSAGREPLQARPVFAPTPVFRGPQLQCRANISHYAVQCYCPLTITHRKGLHWITWLNWFGGVKQTL